MDDIDLLRATVRKLSGRAIQAKMDLHDLSEALPVDWQRIPEVAQATYEAFHALDEAQRNLAGKR